MKLNPVKYKYTFLLIAIGIVWIGFLNFILQIKGQTFVFPDSESYLLASENLYLFHKTDTIRPSLIAAINGFPLLFCLSKNALFLWNTFVNLICWFAIVQLIYQIVSKFTTQKIAFFLSLVYLFSVGSLIIVFQVLSETVFALMLLLSLYFFQKYFENKNEKYISIGISLLILSVLIKPVSLGLVVILLLLFFIKLKKILFRKWSLPLYFSVFVLIFHMYSMKKTYGDFTISYIDAFTYYNYLGTRANCLKNNTKFVQCDNSRYRYFNTLSLAEGKKVAFEDMKNQMTNNTLNLVKAYIINLSYNTYRGSGYFYEFKNVNKTSYFELAKTVFRGISKLQNIFYTLIGIVLSVYFLTRKIKEMNFIKMVSLFVLYVFLISGISSDQGDRFHIVFYPFVMLLLVAYFLEKGFLKSKAY